MNNLNRICHFLEKTGEYTLFFLDLRDITQTEISNAWDYLDSYEKIRFSSFTQKRSKHVFALCRSILKQQLSIYIQENPKEINFRYSQSGKPYLSNSNIHFNLSHSHDFALVGISHYLIGVDIEKMDSNRQIESIARFLFTAKELEWCIQGFFLERFYVLWTLKEAYVKCNGCQFDSNIFPELSFSKIDCISNQVPSFSDCHTYSMQWSGYMISVCIKKC